VRKAGDGDGSSGDSDSDFFTLEMPGVSGTAPQDVHLWLQDLIGVYEFFRSVAGEGLVEWARSVHLSAPPKANAPTDIIDSEPIRRSTHSHSFTDVFPPTESLAKKHSTATTVPLEEQLSGFDYDSIIEYAAKHWDSPERLTVVLVAFRRNLPKWSAMMPVGWRGQDDVERIEQQMYRLLQASRAPSPASQASPSKVERSASSSSQAPGVPEWPKEARETADVALSATVFFHSKGMLSFMGYQVGRVSSLTPLRRRKILDYVYRGVLPSVNDRHYMNEWGEPKASRRLRKLANTLAALARNARRRRSKSWHQAIADWEADLAYLKDRYYDRRRRDWHWPKTVR
jgi:hypothetical protein